MVQKLAEKFTDLNGKATTTGDVFKLISQRAVPFEMVKEVLTDMTDQGGQFYNMQYTLSDTLAGKWNNLKDAYEILLGDMASGKSVVGASLKVLVEGLTSSIKLVGTLSPLLKGLAISGAAFGIGKTYNRVSGGGLAGVQKNYLQAKALVAADMQREIMADRLAGKEHVITNEVRQTLATKKQMTMVDWQILAQSGRLSARQMAILLKKKQITSEMVHQAVIAGAITAEEEAMILQGRVLSLTWKSIGVSIKGAMASIGPIGWISLVIGAAIESLMYFTGKASEANEKMKEFGDTSAERFKKLNDEIKAQDKTAPTTDADYATQIEGLEEILKDYGAVYDRTMAEVDQVDKLSEKYKILKDAVDNTAGAYKTAADNAGLLKEIDEKTSAQIPHYYKGVMLGQFKESMDNNMGDWNDSNTAAQQAFANMGQNDIGKIQESIDALIEKYKNLKGVLYDSDGKPLVLEEQIKKLTETSVTADGKIKAAIVTNPKIAEDLYKGMGSSAKGAFQSYYDEVKDRENVLQNDLMPDFKIVLQETKEQLLLSGQITESDIANMTDKYKNEMLTLSEGIMATHKNWSKDMQAYFESVVIPMQLKFRPYISYVGNKDLTGMAKDAFNSLHKNTVNMGGFTKNDFQQAYGDSGGDIVAAQKYFQQKIDDQDKLVKAIKRIKNKTKAQKNQLVIEENTLRNYQTDMRNLYLPEPSSKSGGKGGGNADTTKTDALLNKVKERYSLYKKFFSEYKKTYDLFGNGAMAQMKKDGEFKSVFSWGISDGDLADYEKTTKRIEAMLGKNPKGDRGKFVNDANTDIYGKKREEEADRVKSVNDALTQQLKILNEQYDAYKKLYELTGDKGMAGRIAFGGHVQSKTYKDELSRQMDDLIKKSGSEEQKKYSGAAALGLSEADFNKAFGKDSEKFSVLYNNNKENEKKLNSDTIDLYNKLIEDNRTINEQIDARTALYKDQLKLIKESKTLTDEDKAKAVNSLTKTYNTDTSKLKFEDFKNTSGWAKIFDDLGRSSTESLKVILPKIEKFAKTQGLPAADQKELVSSVRKIYDELAKRNPFEAMSRGVTGMSDADYMLGVLKEKGITKQNEKFTVESDHGKYKKGQTVTLASLANDKQESSDDFITGLRGLDTAFKALQDVLSPVTALFEQLGSTTLGDVTSIGGNALSAAVQGGTGMQSLSGLFDSKSGIGKALGSAGPYVAAASAALSVTTSLFALHDKAIEKEIEASKERQKLLDNLKTNVEKLLERTMGGVYNFEATGDMLKELEKYQATTTNKLWKELTGTNKKYPYITIDTSKQISEASQSQSYYDVQLATLMAQRDETQYQMDKENAKKKTDSSKIADYKQNIEELDDEITNFAQDMAKSLYDIDYKTWADDLAQTLVDAWAAGEDGAEKYKDKVGDILKQVASKVLAAKIEEMLTPDMTKFLDYFKKNNGIIDDEGLAIIAELYDKASSAQDAADALLNGLETEANKHGETLYDTSDSSGSSAIQSITEDTADLLLSYINAMRADLSVNVQNLQRLMDDILPGMTNLFAQQLAQLKAIEANTRRSADGVDALNDTLNDITKGIKKLAVKAYAA